MSMDEILCTACQTSIPQSLQSHCTGVEPSLDSRVVQLRTCNDAPLDDEVDRIRSSLINAQSRLEYVQDSIEKFEESLESLRFEQQNLEDYIHDRNIVLHPIRRMPVELLIRIFKLCVERADGGGEQPNQHVFSSLDIRGMRWVLGYVCREWRSIMLSSPQLWTDIQLKLGDGEVSWRRAVLLDRYISHSETLPLSISISLDSERNSYYDGFTLNETHAYLSLLSSSTHRWNSLFLSGMSSGAIQHCFCSTKHLLSSLQKLSVSDCHWDGSPECDIFQASPALREVIFRKVRVEMLSFSVPFRRLSTLQLEVTGFMDVSRLLDYLGRTQKLETLIVECAKFSGGRDVAPGDSLILPLLKHLEIRCRPSFDMLVSQQAPTELVGTLESFLLPHLNFLRVINTPASFETIKSLISRSFCAAHLTELVTDAVISEEDFIYLVANYPALVTINLENIDDLTDRGIEDLAVKPEGDHEPYLPKLEFIRLRGELCFDADRFVNVIASRWKVSSEGKGIARPWTIELGLGLDLPSSVPRKFRDAFLRLDGSEFHGLQWKVVEYQLARLIEEHPDIAPSHPFALMFGVPVSATAQSGTSTIKKGMKKKK